MKILIAGASGALGHPLVTRLLKTGHTVWGLTRHPESAAQLQAQGAQAFPCDVLEAAAVQQAFEHIRPDTVIDFLSALPKDPFDLAQALPNDARLRLTGGKNLLEAAELTGVQRYLLQSSGFYLDAPPGQLATEHASFRINAPGHVGESSRLYTTLEKRLFTSTVPLKTALRYGFIYGPRTWYTQNGIFAQHLKAKQVPLIGSGQGVYAFIHVEDAAKATENALTAAPGLYNITDAQPQPFANWLTEFTNWVQAPEPLHVSPQEGLNLCGPEIVYCENHLSGANNQKARNILALTPRKRPWTKSSP